MDYEKKYNKALERAKTLYENAHGMILKKWVEQVFPELAESEDERIRKALIKGFNECLISSSHYPENAVKYWHGIVIDDILAWLEKQGEQKPADNVEPKFKVGDVMRTLQEAADNITSGLPVVVSIDNDNEYYRCTNELIAIKDQDDYEYPPMNRIQKPSWKPSEEDEKTIDIIISFLEEFSSKDYIVRKHCINWLKSLKDGVGCEVNCTTTWNPSDEQIGALEHFVRSITESGFASPYDSNTKLVYSLLNDLKKLKL